MVQGLPRQGHSFGNISKSQKTQNSTICNSCGISISCRGKPNNTNTNIRDPYVRLAVTIGLCILTLFYWLLEYQYQLPVLVHH